MYSEPGWDADEMQAVNQALARMLRQHEPYPAIVMDRYWNVLFSNDYAPRLFAEFIDISARPGPRNLLRLMFDPDGMRPHIANWDELSGALLERVRRESVGAVVDDRTRGLLIDLAAYAGPHSDAGDVTAGGAGPVISTCLKKDGRLLRYFSMVSTVGTPQSISTQELRVESMFPADGETEGWHLKTFAASGSGGSPHVRF